MLYLITADAPLKGDQGGREHILASGDSIFVRGGEVSTIGCRSRSRFTNIAVALADLRAFYSGAYDLAMRVVSRQSDLLGLLHAYVDLLLLRADAIDDRKSVRWGQRVSLRVDSVVRRSHKKK